MNTPFPEAFINNLQEGPLRLLEPLAQQICCQQVAQYWEDVILIVHFGFGMVE